MKKNNGGDMLKGKRIVLGVTGSIAAYKTAHLASLLKKEGAHVSVIETESAVRFVQPLTFDALTGNRTFTDLFDRGGTTPIPHIELGQNSDVILIAPASADIIGKAANGIADDLLSSTIIASSCPVLFAPAMNTQMFGKKAVQENLQKLSEMGYGLLKPNEGMLACGTYGIGKMPEPEELLEWLEQEIGCEKDLQGKSMLVTAGATREAIDPVRFISNHSTGKMGTEIARDAARRGADVTLVFGNMTVPVPRFVKGIHVNSAEDMFQAVMKEAPSKDIVVMAAAVADYRPVKAAEEKIKKDTGAPELKLMRTKDILEALGEKKKEGQFLCGFAMETENLIPNAQKKLAKKHADMIVANNLKQEGAGFGVDTNVVTLVMKDKTEELPVLSKAEVAHRVLDAVLKLSAGNTQARRKR
jgi:phosphopantothenoylcysteine decarboxylase/phosphopantothenate--cysteine ligase